MENQNLTQGIVSQLGGAASQVIAGIREAASQSGASFDAMLATAKIESGLNPNAKAPSSSATGLFQFVDQTWLATVKRVGAGHGLGAQASAIISRNGQYTVADPAMRQEILDLRKDPKVAAAMAGEHLKDLSATLSQNLGRAPTVTETYLGHFLGAGGATQMLKALQNNPGASASSVLPDAARSNPGLFSGQTVSQFINKVSTRVEKAYADLNLPMPQGGVQMANSAGGVPGAAPASAGASGSDGWGSNGAPQDMSSAAERVMLSSLSEVFTRVDRSLAGGGATNKQLTNGHLPVGTVAALANTAPGSI